MQPQNSQLIQIDVDLEDRSYPIYIGANAIDSVNLEKFCAGKKVLIVTNKTLAPLYLENLISCLPNKQVDHVALEDGEQFKRLDVLNQVFTSLLEKRHDRKTTLIALGGGVVGDMTGFAAACYQRGVSFIQVPTTLLAQVDSSVGGKTGVNHPLGKNMIGAFYQPQAVIIDTTTLATLPDRELRGGLAEVIKYGLIRDSEFFAWLETNCELLLSRDEAALAYAIERSCTNKAQVVAEDEREQGTRALLNLGHTFGHAIETFQNYSGWLHGEAVAAGIVMAAELSAESNNLSRPDLQRIISILHRCSLPVSPPSGMLPEDFRNLMTADKKVLDGNLRLILLHGIGAAYVKSDVDLAQLDQVLSRLCGN